MVTLGFHDRLRNPRISTDVFPLLVEKLPMIVRRSHQV